MTMRRYTIAELRQMRESEDHVEFKKGEQGNVSYNGGDKAKPKDRRKCILGYVIALCNEGGGRMVIGMHDDYPHKVTGKQIRRYLDILKSNGLLKTEGQNRTTIYLLGNSYAANNELISKALAIGLQELKDKGEI